MISNHKNTENAKKTFALLWWGFLYVPGTVQPVLNRGWHWTITSACYGFIGSIYLPVMFI
jgi:hypothetical protein